MRNRKPKLILTVSPTSLPSDSFAIRSEACQMKVPLASALQSAMPGIVRLCVTRRAQTLTLNHPSSIPVAAAPRLISVPLASCVLRTALPLRP